MAIPDSPEGMWTDSGGKDMIELLTEDHREVAAMFDQLQTVGGSASRKRQIADVITAELVRHSVAEEEYLYPTVRVVLDGGDDLADREIGDHQQVEQALKQLEGVQATEDRFADLMDSLAREVRRHVEDEESELFPRLREACSSERLAELGRQVQRAKENAPTRPHPAVPNSAGATVVLAPGAGLVDRVRDLVSGRSERPEAL